MQNKFDIISVTQNEFIFWALTLQKLSEDVCTLHTYDNTHFHNTAAIWL